MKHIPPILHVPGMLSQNEGEYLYHLAQLNPAKGVIVEIGSWKGKSTICLALGSMAVSGEKVYAVDPHKPLAEEGYTEDTEAQFRENIRNAGVESHVVPDGHGVGGGSQGMDSTDPPTMDRRRPPIRASEVGLPSLGTPCH